MRSIHHGILIVAIPSIIPMASGAQSSAASASGRIVGIVTAGAGNPLGFADIRVEPSGLTTFADGNGVFRVRVFPPGDVTIRVRRLGFMPVVVTVNATSDGEDTIRVSLEPLALHLDRVRVSDMLCPKRDTESVDSMTLAIIEQIRANAERNKLLAREYPFVASMERTIGDAPASLGARNERAKIIRIDTLSIAGEHDWHYQPGNLFQPNEGEPSRNIADEKMIVPQLADFGDDAFINSHCFHYAGVVTDDGLRRARVDFEPNKSIREPDARGSMYLDQTSYEITHTMLRIERPRGSDTWDVRVDTWFRALLPALPIVDRVCSRTTIRTLTPRGERVGPRAAVENQRLLNIEFERRAPAPVPHISPLAMSCPRDS